MNPKRVGILLLFVLFLSTGKAQISFDSSNLVMLEEKIIKSSADEKTGLLLGVAESLVADDQHKTRLYALRAFDNAKALNDSLGMARAVFYLGEAAYYLNQNSNADSLYNQATHFLHQHPDSDSLKAAIFLAKAMNCNQQGLYLLADSLYVKALGQYPQFDFFSSEIWFQRGNNCYAAGKTKQAVECYFEAIEIGQQINNPDVLASVYNSLGIVFGDLGSYEKALKNYMLALKIYDSIGDNQGMAYALNNIGIIYYDWGNKEKALEYYQKSMRMDIALKNSYGLAGSYNNIGIIYSDWKQDELAIDYYQKALGLYEKFKDSIGVSNALNNIGESYSAMGDYSKALNYLFRSLELEKKYGSSLGRAQSYHAIANVYTLSKNYLKALEYNNLSYQLANDNGFLVVLIDVHELFYKIFKEQGKYNEALESLSTHELLKDSIYNDQFVSRIASLQMQNEVDRAERERLAMEREYKEKKRQLSVQKIYLSIILFLLIIFGILVFIDIRTKTRANKKLLKVNQDLGLKQKELSETIIKLKDSEAKYLNLVDYSPLGILNVAIDQTILSANRKAIELFEFKQNEHLIGVKITDLEQLNDSGLFEEIEKCSKVGQSSAGEFSYEDKWGKIIWLKFYITPIKDYSNRVKSVLINLENITSSKEADQLIRQSENKYQILVENSLQAMLIIQDAKIIFANCRMEELSHYTFNELASKGKRWLNQLIHPEDLRRSIQNVNDALAGKKVRTINEYRIKRKDGKLRWIETMGSVVNYQGVPSMLMVAVDITERKKARSVLEKSEQELKSANAMKDKFFSIIAHDLKNPFSSIMGLSNLLYEAYDNFSEQQRKSFLKNMCEASESTFKLLQNLLEWSKTQTGRIQYTPEKLQLMNLINETVSLVNSSLRNKRLSIETKIPIGMEVHADMNMIKTVVRNLVSNAIKFTKPGGNITISAEKSKNNYIVIAVKDTGVGISSENQKRLFRIDDQFKSMGTNEEKGSGLGLLLCSEFVKINKGQIWVESEPNQGSTFSFSLPLLTQ